MISVFDGHIGARWNGHDDGEQGPPVKHITKANFTSDTLYPRVTKATHALLAEHKQVSPAAVFVKMGMLSEADFLDWRAGQIPYLEKVIRGSLGKVSRVLRILANHAAQRGLVPVLAHYMGPGRARVVRLRFSKSGERTLEETYRRHFVPPHPWPSSRPAERQTPPSPPGARYDRREANQPAVEQVDAPDGALRRSRPASEPRR